MRLLIVNKLFDYVTSITHSKQLLELDGYNSFMVNRALSQYSDCVLAANEMNIYHQLDADLQYSFLINSIRRKKRFSKWSKTSKDEVAKLAIIKEYYGYSSEKAKQVMDLCDIEDLQRRICKGGK